MMLVAASSTRGDITLNPPSGLPVKVVIQRGSIQVQLRKSWSCLSVVTRGGRALSLVDPVLYGITPLGGQHLRWPDHGWERLKWAAVEQSKKRDVLYVEGDYEGWRVQAWMAVYGEEEALYVRKRTVRIRSTAAGVRAWGTLGASYGKGDFENGRFSVFADGRKVNAPSVHASKSVLYRWPDRSAAVLNPGDGFRSRGPQARDFLLILHHPKPRFVEALLPQEARQVQPGEYLETAFVLMWGDGDISPRVQQALANQEALAARLPEAARPSTVTREKERVPMASTAGLRPALVRAKFETPAAGHKRVCLAGRPLEEAPAVDGQLDDTAWKGPWQGHFVARNTVSEPAEIKTSFRVARAAQSLYLAVRCEQPDLGKVRWAKHQRQKYSSGEQVEIFFLIGEKVVQVCVDPGGKVFDQVGGNAQVDLPLKAAAQKTEKGWACELEIPFRSLGFNPAAVSRVGFNLVRDAAQIQGPIEYSGWNSARGAFVSVRNFGTLFLGSKEDIRKDSGYRLEALLDRDVYDTLTVSAGAWLEIQVSGEMPDGAMLIARIARKGEKPVRGSQVKVTGQVGDVVLDLHGLPPGEYEVRFTLVSGGEALASARRPFRIRRASSTPVRRGRIPVRVSVVHAPAMQPVSLGVAFPRGALDDPGRVRLLDSEGRETPIQTAALARWDPAGSISWLRVNFQAEMAVKEKEWVLEYGAASSAKPSPGIRIQELEDVYRVNTGPLEFGVPRLNGGVLRGVSLDANHDGKFSESEQVVLGGPELGPYLVDREGRVYRAALDTAPEVKVEVPGPLKAVFRIESWYRSENGEQLCKQVTRLSAYAGLASLRIEHTWILTRATGEAAFRDIGFALPMKDLREVVYGTEDGPFQLANRFPSFLIQRTERDYAIHAGYQRVFVADRKTRAKVRQRAMVEGAHAPGWVAVWGATAGLALAVDDFWQNFPKELEMDGRRLTFHLWPKHGRPRARPINDSTVAKLDFVHGGELLDFTVPKEVAEYQPVNPYERHFLQAAAKANAIGIAKTHRFALTFFPGGQEAVAAIRQAQAVADTPNARAAPEWMAASRVFGPMHPKDPAHFPEIEKAFDLASRVVPRLNREGSWYGMWLYGQLHTTYNFAARRWNLYRVFNQLHHSGPRWPWLMWVRSGESDLLDFALANTRVVADVGFCHFSRPEFEKLGWPAGKIRGALTDYKGLVPWHSGSRNPDYNSMTAFLLWHTYFTGDGWTRDVALEWGRLAKQQGPAGGSRTGAGTVRASMDLYTATWDIGLIPIYRKTANALLNSQLPDGSFPEWENYSDWLADYAGFTGQPNARAALLRWADAHLLGHGDLSEVWGTPINLIAQAWFASGKKQYARYARGYLESWCRSVYDDPDSDLRGVPGGRSGSSLSFLGFFLPRNLMAQQAWAKAGLETPPLYPRTWYGWSPRCADGLFRIEVLLLDEKDAPLELQIDGFLHGRERDPQHRYELRARLLGPNGKTVHDQSFTTAQRVWTAHRLNRYAPRHWLKLSVPPDGQRGVYRLIVESRRIEFGLCLPLSGAREVVGINLDDRGRLLLNDHLSRASFYLPSGMSRAEVRFNCGSASPQTVQIRDPKFQLAGKLYLDGLFPQTQVRNFRIDSTRAGTEGFWTVTAGRAHAIWLEFKGGWRPEYYAVDPARAFRPEKYRAPIRQYPLHQP